MDVTAPNPNVARSRSALVHPAVLVVLALLVIAVVVTFVARASGTRDDRGTSSDLYEVARGGFDITIPASGELAAVQQIEIRNRLEVRAVITQIVDEGTSVAAGDVVIRFNDEDIRTRIDDAVDDVDTADNILVNARAVLDIRRQVRASELARADLDIRLAELDLLAWREGEDVSRRKELALAIETAQKQYDRLFDRYNDSKDLLEQKFISLDEYRQDEIEMIQAKARLEQAQLDIEVYEKYEFEEEKATKESNLQQAREERVRVEQRYDAEVRSAESDVRSAEHQLESKQERLAKLEQQFEYCTVEAPADGLVVFASSLNQGRHWRGEQQGPQVGSEVSRNELIMVLPDTTQMVAEVKVNEALSGLIESGQRASVVSDAIPDVGLAGTVESIGVLAESGGWRDPNRRDYTVRVLLDDVTGHGLKPSMRCKANIAIGRVDDAVYVPIQAVTHEGPRAFVFVDRGGRYSQKPVTLGRASDLYVEVLEGVDAGMSVLLRQPRPQEIIHDETAPADDGGDRMARGEEPGPGGPPREGRGGKRRGGPPAQASLGR
ncbi:MAG: efflux RND transporter periplasmic adaptor subunit [Planctomycetota bacterium]|jgi:HlyD family secretion protein